MLTSASLAIVAPLLVAADRRDARKEKLLNLRAIQLFLSTFQAFPNLWTIQAFLPILVHWVFSVQEQAVKQ